MTMAAALFPLIERLPPVRGTYSADDDIARATWFKVGGRAEVAFRPADADDLATFLANRPAEVPVTVIGAASNLIVRDGGVPGVVVRLGRPFGGIVRVGDDVVAGAGALGISVARFAASAGLGGLEFLSGIPGTIGGAVRMNAGAYGGEVAQVIRSALALDPSGDRHRLTPADLRFAYRSTALPADWIVVEATFAAVPAAPAAVAARMARIAADRAASQPVRTRTGGSTFKNPPGAKAWELIDRAGCRGLRRGDAMVSEMHCNFLINTGRASAADLEALGEDVRRRVLEATGIALEWEIRRIGMPKAGSRR